MAVMLESYALPKTSRRALLREEAAGLAQLSVPMTLAIALELGPPIVVSMMIGKVSGEKVIAAGSLSDFFQGLVTINVILGLGAAITTVCSHAYGAKQYECHWLYAQAGLLGSAYLALPITLLSLCGAPILRMLGQDAQLASIAERFILVGLAALPFLTLYTVARSVLQAQNVAVPFVVASLIATVISLPLGYVLGNYTSLGYIGITLSIVLMALIKCVAGVVIVLRDELFLSSWPGWQWQKANRLVLDLWKIGVGSVLMTTFQTAGVMSMSVLCGFLPNASLAMAASGIGGNFITLAFMPLMGISTAGMIRIGNAIGGNQPLRASAASAATLFGMLGMSVVGVVVCWILARPYAAAYTNDSVVMGLATRLSYHLLPFIPLVAVSLTGQALFQACNAQWLCALLNFLFLLVTAVGVGLLLAIPLNGGLMGLWNGQMIGSTASVIASIIWYRRLNWQKTVDEAKHAQALRLDRAETTGLSPNADSCLGSGSMVFMYDRRSSSCSAIPVV